MRSSGTKTERGSKVVRILSEKWRNRADGLDRLIARDHKVIEKNV